MAIQHEDFGEKIGGAKKDLWKTRGLLADDLNDMNEREANQFVKKENAWKKPDYPALIESGIPADVVYFIKKVRDSLPASPQYRSGDNTPELRLARQRQYIETVRDLQDMVEPVRTAAEAMQVYRRFLEGNGYISWTNNAPYSTPYSILTPKGQENTVITAKLRKTLYVSSEEQFFRDFTQEAQKEQFGVKPEDKIPKGYAIRFNDGKYTYSASGDWQPNTYYVTKGSGILETNFATKEDAFNGYKLLPNSEAKAKAVKHLSFRPSLPMCAGRDWITAKAKR